MATVSLWSAAVRCLPPKRQGSPYRAEGSAEQTYHGYGRTPEEAVEDAVKNYTYWRAVPVAKPLLRRVQHG